MSDCSQLPLPELIEALQARGVRFTTPNGELHIRGWAKCSEGERQRLRDEREALVALLQNEAEPPEIGNAKEPISSEPKPATPSRPKERTAAEEKEHMRQRLASSGGLTPEGEELLGSLVLESKTPESELSQREIMAGRMAFARRFNLPYD